MRLKKVALIFALAVFAVLALGAFNISNAAQGSKYMGIQPLRSSGYGYMAFEKNVWKIVEYESNQTTYDYDSTIYCLRAGPGFGSDIFGSGTPKIRHYTEYFNMKDPDSIESPYDAAIPEPGSETYNSLLWLLENIYVAPSSKPVGTEAQDAADFKSQLLKAAGVQEGLLTDDDIDVVQQLAVWHFTNMGNNNYDAGTTGNFELSVTVDPGYDRNYMPLSDDTYFTNGWNRALAAQKLYRYLVQTATSMASSYKVTTASQPYEIADTQVSVANNGNNYVIGPYKIEQISQTTGTLEGTFQNGNGETLNPVLQDERGQRYNSLEETVGQEFYIVLPDTTNIERLIFTITGSYFETNIEYWSVENAPGEDQPVAIVDRVKKDYTDSKEITYEKKIFDLALRKYINSVISGEQTTNYDRTPQITQEQIDGLYNETIETAEKTHTKTPVQVKPGDRVIYTIMIYNEGNVNGYASEITDYLPEGLRLASNSSINTQYGWTNPSGDGRTVATTALADDIIYGVSEENGTAQLRAQFVQIECEVVAEIGEHETSLKNVAEITEAKDGEGNERQDRDSTPENLTEEQKNNYNPGESERGWGYEDDDDYEELYLPRAEGDFEIKIVKVNGIGNGLPDVTFEIVEATPRSIDSRDLGYEPTEFTTDENGEILTGRQYCDTYREFYIREVNVPEGYEKLPETINLKIYFNIVDGRYVAEPEIANDDPTLGGRILKLEVQENNTIVITIENSYFDLSLRKFVTTINGNPVATNGTPAVDRTPQISDETKQNLFNRNTTTAEKTHTKEPLQVKPGDRVVYTIRVYNEGEKAGHAAEITDYLPEGLRFVEDSDINRQNGWTNPSGDGRTIVTTALADDLINAFDGTTLDYKDVQIECEVVAEYGDSNISLKNIAEITKATNEEGNDAKDRDSMPKDLTDEQKNNYNPGESEKGWGYEDDDDYEELVLPAPTGDFELKLIKVNGLGNRLSGATFKVEELNSNGDVVNTYDNLTTNEAGEVVTDRINISGVGTYTFVITENAAPDGYELLAEPIRLEVKIEIVDGVYTVTEAKAVRAEEDVGQSNLQGQNFNAAEMLATTISLETDNLNVNEDAQTVSIANGAVKSVEVNGNTVEITIENSYFDLALRKFITTINGNPVATHGTPAVDRTPQISDETKQNLFNRNTTTAEKTHTKEPLQVNTGDSVVYTIRVYNEGEIAGHAAEITDYLPDGLKLKENSSINAQYGWTNPNGDGKTIVTTALEGELINAFDGTTLDYKDVQIECEVVAEIYRFPTTLKNVAEITKATDEEGNEREDRDSTPGNLTEKQKNDYNPGESEKGWGYEDDDDYEELYLPGATGDYEIKVVKVNGIGNGLPDVSFEIYEGGLDSIEDTRAQESIAGEYQTDENGEFSTGRIEILSWTRDYYIKETSVPNGYEPLQEAIILRVNLDIVDGKYVAEARILNEDPTLGGRILKLEVQENNTIVITIENSYFDLSLRKFVTTINGNPVATNGTPAVDRTPQISDETKQNLFNRNTTTAEKTHTKEPLQVKTGDRVVYTIRVYNEGEIAGHAAEITDYLPEGLRFVEDSDINKQYGWTNPNGDGRTVVTTALADDLINAFDGTTLDYKDVQIECEVVAIKGQNEQKLKNVAEITKATDEEGNDAKDRDSTPENLTEEQKENYNPGESEKGWGYEDDDDYEELVLPAVTGDFKIKLIKQNGLGNRLQDAVFKVEEVNTEGTVINTFDDLKTNENGEILIDNFNIEQEGDRTFVITEKQAPKGYEVLPEPITIQVQIRLVNGEYVIIANAVSGDGAKKQQEISTEENAEEQKETTDTAKVSNRNVGLARVDKVRSLKLSSKKFSNNEQINTISNGINLAANTNSGEDVNANASETSSKANGGVADVRVNGDTIEVVIENNAFDLSLRKFITGVNDEEITNRVPVFSIKDGEYVYTHTKDPVEVANGDIVIYTLRVYNEGTLAGYAEEVKDDLPEGLEFLPDNSVNTEYRWVMYDENGEVTENVADAVSIRTDYLSKAQADETGRDNLLAAFNQDTMSQPDYRDLQIAFRVTEPNTSDRVLINTAEISEDSDENGDPVVDIDSTPDNDKEDEDDIDIEKVKVTYFDLALRKIISKVTMTLDGKTTVEETGHQFEDDPEEVVKIELGNHKIEDSVLKFTYQIRITNEGNKAGYAYEIKDYIPEGLRFVEEDNEGWVLSEDGKTVTTDQLKDVLLEPGDSRVVEITLRWINGQTNLGVKQNWAEISEDSDDDIDSTPDNKVEGEDDIDEASVVLSIVTGIGEKYALVIGTVLVITAGGVFLIKRFVL